MYTHSKFDLTWIRTHDLQIIPVTVYTLIQTVDGSWDDLHDTVQMRVNLQKVNGQPDGHLNFRHILLPAASLEG